ncbi:ABC transporter permease subunit [Nakamurella flavida]|uniref:ABC transporter permease subunit n=1 Tax=Nakamurella flavida TaxID=363630 RepID=A0A938YHB5_9ACTN|nr:ABC transporter permease subunit [Nakamurella flavida]MBM9477680.1 ABC transporter permease subunit [Nakamurella flavida]MDP9779232.1 putative spermidine/putrescine transport system permease protein [Nakamurella flavida]
MDVATPVPAGGLAPLGVASTDPAPPVRGSRVRAGALLPTVPFFAYLALFLLLPTVLVAVGAFRGPDGFTLANFREMGSASVRDAFVQSIALSAITAVIGAVVGGVVAVVLAAGADGVLRRVVVAACSVLAQFGGVMLAFAFIATVGTTGLVTTLLADVGVASTGGWLYEFPGLVLVYTYFQIPLMVIVFLPAAQGLRPQWREATESLGGTGWVFWRRVGGPLLAPAFLGSALLLFANAFSAYATAAALITQYNTLVPLQIRGALISDVNLGQGNLASALALGMVVVVAVVMAGYAWLGRRSARWLR